MMTKETGGPAFPTSHSRDYPDEINGGLTLRDYFAAQAPITVEDAMLACGCDTHSVGMLTCDQRVSIFFMLAEMRFEYADAMLAERTR